MYYAINRIMDREDLLKKYGITKGTKGKTFIIQVMFFWRFIIRDVFGIFKNIFWSIFKNSWYNNFYQIKYKNFAICPFIIT